MTQLSCGAIWLKTSKKGEKFFSGMIELDGKKVDIVGFKNSYKTEDKHPDYRLFLSEPMEKREQVDDMNSQLDRAIADDRQDTGTDNPPIDEL